MRNENNELIIDETNFKDYFFDVRLNKPQKGQVMASCTFIGELLDGPEKRQIIEFLRYTDNVQSAMQVMRKALLARESDAIRIPQEIADDLLSGMSVEEVARKPYKFTAEMFFWTKPEYIPRDDPHWSCVSILNLEDHLSKKESDIKVEARLADDWEDGKLPEGEK